jgi:uncharacterized membrane protein YjjP (DUF1212 family)
VYTRVEDTVSRICKAYGAVEADVFSITSSIVTSIEDPEGKILTQTKRIYRYQTDFQKLDQLNALSRYICTHRPEADYIREEILRIRSIEPVPGLRPFWSQR